MEEKSNRIEGENYVLTILFGFACPSQKDFFDY